MAQHDYVIENAAGAAVRADINNVLQAIITNNSGATEPATTYPNMWWYDTSTGLLKRRNNADDAWITVGLEAADTDGTLAANSDSKIATQKATKTYADTKVAASALDTDGTLAANSDSKVATQKAVKTYADTLLGSFDITDHVAILTGTITNGQTIPLPDGFSQAQCKWMVSFATIYGNGLDQHETFVLDAHCSADANRVVTVNNKRGSSSSATANYMIIGIK